MKHKITESVEIPEFYESINKMDVTRKKEIDTLMEQEEKIASVSIGFADWIFSSGYVPIKDSDKWEDEDLPFTEYNTEQLYNIYLLTLNEK